MLFHNSSLRSILISSVSNINVASGGIVSPAPALPYAKSDGITKRRFSPSERKKTESMHFCVWMNSLV